MLDSFFEITCTDARLRPIVGDLWEPFAIKGETPDPISYGIKLDEDIYELHASEGISRYYDPWVLLDALRGYLTHRALYASTDVVGVHASVISRDGDALLLIGQPYSGKTTLMLALLERGWSYVSDDLAPFRDHRMIGFPKPLSIRSTDRWTVFGRRWQGAFELPAPRVIGLLPRKLFGTAPGEVAPRWIVFPTYEEGADGRIEKLSPGFATARCLQNVQNPGPPGKLAAGILGALCSSLPVAAISYGSTEAALGLLEDAIQGKA